MFAWINSRLMLFALLGFFAFVVLTQRLSAPEPKPGPVEGSKTGENRSPSAGGSAAGEKPPDTDAFDAVLLFYADGLARVARHYRDAESQETAALLLKRVFFLRNQILGPNHPSTAEAKLGYDEALRTHEDTGAGSAH